MFQRDIAAVAVYDRQVLNVAVPSDLNNAGRFPRCDNGRKVRVFANAMDKLEGGDTDDTERIGLINIRDTAVADKVILAMIGK